MKNLLEEMFTVKDCTVPQRLAIKSYCDSKNIKYYSQSTLTSVVGGKDLFWDKNDFSSCNDLNHPIISFSELIQFLDSYEIKPEPLHPPLYATIFKNMHIYMAVEVIFDGTQTKILDYSPIDPKTLTKKWDESTNSFIYIQYENDETNKRILNYTQILTNF